jgi:hypothetical protein
LISLSSILNVSFLLFYVVKKQNKERSKSKFPFLMNKGKLLRCVLDTCCLCISVGKCMSLFQILSNSMKLWNSAAVLSKYKFV